jgi:hypothetical protein
MYNNVKETLSDFIKFNGRLLNLIKLLKETLSNFINFLVDY